MAHLSTDEDVPTRAETIYELLLVPHPVMCQAEDEMNYERTLVLNGYEMICEPMAAWMATSNICRGISSRIFSHRSRPRRSAWLRCTMELPLGPRQRPVPVPSSSARRRPSE